MTDEVQPATKPASTTLRALKKKRGSSNRELARAIAEHGGRLSGSSIGNIARGDDLPSIQALEQLAQALDVPADTFLEVRLARARRLFDERADGVGPEIALWNLDQLARAVPALRTATGRLPYTPEPIAETAGRLWEEEMETPSPQAPSPAESIREPDEHPPARRPR